jgi:archaeal flagellin FlaB
MRKIVLTLCFVLLLVIVTFSGCTSTQTISVPEPTSTPQIVYVTVFVTPTPTPPTPQIVYVTVTVPVTQTVTAQKTTYTSVEQSTANIQMIGNVYGLASTPAAGIDEIKFYIGLAPSAQPIDLTKMKIIFSKSGSTQMILIQGDISSKTVFTTKLNGQTAVNSLNANDQVEIDFKIAPVGANTKMIFELRPSVGAALPFTKTAPAMISAINILY